MRSRDLGAVNFLSPPGLCAKNSKNHDLFVQSFDARKKLRHGWGKPQSDSPSWKQ